jgi:hypothetical protein
LKQLQPLLIAILSSLSLTFPGMSVACQKVSSYVVETPLEFDQLRVDQALYRTLEQISGTPFESVFMSEIPAKRISAREVSGPLDQVLTELAKHAGLVFEQSGCRLFFVLREHQALNIKAGELIHTQLAQWLQKNGYSLVWEAQKYRAEAALNLDGPIEATIREVISVMQKNGVGLIVDIYANRLVRIRNKE